MNDFTTLILSFPVIIFTFLFGFVLFYWLLVILGALDLELLDLEGLDELDDGGLESGATGLSGVLANWGLTGVPVTVIASMMTSICWLMTSLVTSLIFPHIYSPQVRLIAGIGLIGVVVAIAIPITARLIRPMRSFFHTHGAVKKGSLTGRDCVVKTLKVTESFGQAEIADGEAGILIDIVATTPNDMTKGDTVVLVEYDEDKDVYFVAKM
ncbi:MAG: hypothetical protein CR974_03655 [Gammaproteobacteria bacterium]|nr:MAG: hypothetical protein CR974_03655 [Gammaproteobacteria bacterium]